MSKGQIRKALSGFYYVYDQGKTFQTRGRGNFRKRQLTPLVGDFVQFESLNQEEGMITELLPRKNELIRPPVANVDLGVVIMSAAEPAFSTQLLDRFLAVLESKNIQAIIYVTKTDLINEEENKKLQKIQQDYTNIGYTFILPEPHDDQEAIEKLTEWFSEKLTVFMGQSGAGKSTLLNAISPHLVLKTGEISQSLGRGKHTTRHVELLPLFDGLVADTPGFSAIEFMDIAADELRECFPEFLAIQDQCKFRGCLHRKEPGCQVKENVKNELIADYRYHHYLQFLDEIERQKPDYTKKKK